jgi:hypothetical protein
MGWRSKSQTAHSEFGLVASEERDALLYAPPPTEVEYDVPQDNNGISPATRRLATVLGRFERHVARAREGAPQELWSDECMTQLIKAVEIAVAEGWPEVVEALTETGRVLQSYENEGQAHLSVRFLTESYEILSQMVSDLILGKVRSGLMQKWRNRYRMALQELKDAGILLVRDDEDPYAAQRIAERAAVRERRGFEPRVARPEPEPAPRPAPFEMPAEDAAPAYRAATPAEAPQIEDYLHEEAAEEEEAFPTDEATLDAEADAEEIAPWLKTPSTPPPWEIEEAEAAAAEETVQADAVEAVEEEAVEELTSDLLGELPPLAPLGGDLLQLGAEELITDEPEEELLSVAGGTAPEVIERLDVLCESLSHMEREPEADLEQGFAVILDGVEFLGRQAELYGRAGCVELCGTMARMCEEAARRGSLPEDKFFELAYAFCGVYVEADEDSDNAMIRGWVGECGSLLVDWATAEPEAVAVAEIMETIEVEPEIAAEVEIDEEEAVETEEMTFEAPVVEAEPEAEVEVEAEPEASVEEEPAEEEHDDLTGVQSPEALLHVAQRAMTEGNASEAKKLALQAAAMLAQVEVDEATCRVNDSERRLQEGAELIEIARRDVMCAEQVVTDSARSVADGQKTLDTRHAEVIGTSQRLQEVETRVADLDEQIRQLQARRHEEAKRVAEIQGELEAARQRESDCETEVTSRTEAEREARMRLEDARQRVKNLQRKRTEVEASMERARETLTRQRLSLTDIQQMLAQVGAQDAPAQANENGLGEFLF